MNWFSCDGEGHEQDGARPDLLAPVDPVTRRGILMGASLALAGWLGSKYALAQVAVSPRKRQDQALVVVFLRGGADGLSIVVPHAEDAYFRGRPTVRVPGPKDKSFAESARTIDLDGFFGFNPLLRPLMPFWESREVLAVHAVGSQDRTRSHFEAMAAMEKGLAAEGSGPANGWLARYLAQTPQTDASPLRAVAFGDVMPDSLRGADQAIVLQRLDEFRLAVDESERAAAELALARLYAAGRDEISLAGRQTLETIRSLRSLDAAHYRPAGGAAYPNSGLGQGFKQVAMLAKSGLGLEVACLDTGGWDTHVAQGATFGNGQNLGRMGALIDDLAKSLAAFMTDLGERRRHVTTVVMTEFGRRVHENSGLGTDHGRASTAFVLGGGVAGGRVLRNWAGLEDDKLDSVGDLRVGTDYRDVLSYALTLHGASAPSGVFPDYEPKPLLS